MRSPIVTRPAECGGTCELPPAQTERCNTHIECPGNAVLFAIVGESGSESTQLYSWEQCVTTLYDIILFYIITSVWLTPQFTDSQSDQCHIYITPTFMVHLFVSSLVDCIYTWGEYTECSKSCGGGTKSRSPIITQHPRHGGRACPPKETKPCNEHNCPGETKKENSIQRTHTLSLSYVQVITHAQGLYYPYGPRA